MRLCSGDTLQEPECHGDHKYLKINFSNNLQTLTAAIL